VLWKASTHQCFRKANIDPSRCSSDPNFVLYLRTDPNRPPAAPRAAASMTSAKCSAMMRDRNHKFYGIWAAQGWSFRQRGEAACWGDGNWFGWVAAASNCQQNWGNNLNAPTVFGFSESMAAYCNSRGGGNNGDPGSACPAAKLNILRIGDWNMCRNAEWMICVIQGQANWGGGGSGDIVFTMSPSMLDMDREGFNDRQGFYSENDIYFLEICTLNEMCSNYEEMFSAAVGDTFRCKFDRERWMAAARDMRQLG